jgi:leucyl/phenylalanyl-tRNA--protein transferase
MIPPTFLLSAYRQGIFPMAMQDGDIGWFSPDPRGVLPLSGFHVPRRLIRARRRFDITIDAAFRRVIEACAARRDTWINDEIIESYLELHRIGRAHSVEAWQEGVLAGGLYGVSIGGAFFGESMFHNVTDASKVALCALIDRLRDRGYALLDIQWTTPHLEQFGAVTLPRRRYLQLLAASVSLDRTFVDPPPGAGS